MGDIVGDETELIIADSRTQKVTKWNVNEQVVVESGHAGGDLRMSNIQPRVFAPPRLILNP